MNSKQRTAIAGIIMALANHISIKSVYSYELAAYVSVSGTAETEKVNVYDYSRSCHISGSSNDGKKYSLYDYGTSAHISLTVDLKKATGYDYASGCHFSATVNGRSVSIYDYESSRYYSYSC